MKSYFPYFVLPALAGVFVGATTRIPAAHACECAAPFWVVERVAVETADPNADDALFWGRQGQVDAQGLDLWASDETPGFSSLDFGP
jgi:hypothetical protein